MSLVTTAMRKRSHIALHSASTSAVFPEPTGPPTPTRNVSRFAVIGLRLTRVARRGRRTKPTAALALQSEPREPAHFGIKSGVIGDDRAWVRWVQVERRSFVFSW